MTDPARSGREKCPGLPRCETLMGAARCPQPCLERGCTPGAGVWCNDRDSSLSPAAFEIKRRAKQHGCIRQGEGVRKDLGATGKGRSTATPGINSTFPTGFTEARKFLPGLPKPPAYNCLSSHIKAGLLAESRQEQLLGEEKGICKVFLWVY